MAEEETTETAPRRWAGNEPRRLRVYDLSLHLAEQVNREFDRVRAPLSLREQAQRAADSVALNIAEGSAHRTAGMKVRYYRTARASTAECIAALDLLQRRIPRAFTTPARRNAEIVSKMLNALIDQWEARR